RRLADRDHVRTRAELAEKIDQMSGVVVETEAAGAQGNIARIVPVGDVDVVVLQQRLHGAAEQGGEMAGHRRNQEQPRLLRRVFLLETQERAEWRRVSYFLGHPKLAVAGLYLVDAVGGAGVGEGGARDQLECGGKPAKQLIGHPLRDEVEIAQ